MSSHFLAYIFCIPYLLITFTLLLPLLYYCLYFITAFTILLPFLPPFSYHLSLLLPSPSILLLSGLLGGIGMNSFFHFHSGDTKGNRKLLIEDILRLLHKV